MRVRKRLKTREDEGEGMRKGETKEGRENEMKVRQVKKGRNRGYGTKRGGKVRKEKT